MHRRLFIAALGSLTVATATATAVQAQTPRKLDNAGLAAMLTNMGLQPKALSKGYLVKVQREKWTFYVQFVLSPDETKLGLNANLGLVNEANVTAERWKALLEANGNLDPSTIYFDGAQKKLFLHRSLDNRDITPDFLQLQLTNFIDGLKSSQDVWGPVVP